MTITYDPLDLIIQGPPDMGPHCTGNPRLQPRPLHLGPHCIGTRPHTSALPPTIWDLAVQGLSQDISMLF